VSVQSITQEVASIANALSVVVLGVGYYFLIKLYREWLRQTEERRIAGGRPQVVVSASYAPLPDVNIMVRNFNSAPAKEISFEFSAPIEDSHGFTISDLPFFEKGLDFLEPNGEISLFWDSLPNLAPVLRRNGLEDGIRVTTKYKDLAGESYESEWTINPLLFEVERIETRKGMNDLVAAVEKIPTAAVSRDEPRNGSDPRVESEGS
jgi:hypothetical protein